jgi:hypothetical protein
MSQISLASIDSSRPRAVLRADGYCETNYVRRRSEDFLVSVVEPTVQEFLDDMGDVRRGRLAAIVLNHMIDYWAVDEKIASHRSLRERLQQECPLLSVIRDVADASKHAQVSKSDRLLFGEEQLSRPPGLFQAPFRTGVFAEASVAIVTLDDGRQIPLERAARAVLLMWVKKLHLQ